MHLNLRTIQHINFIVDDYPAAQQHFVDKYGAELNWELEIPNRPDDIRASLLTIGPVLYEILGPETGATSGLAQVYQQQGAGFIGIEWGLGDGTMNPDDLAEAKEALKEHGIRIRFEPKKRYFPGTWFVAEPDDLFGLALECFIGTWYTPDVAGYGMKVIAPDTYWREEHPLAIHGLRNFTVAVNDVDAAAKKWQGLTGAGEVKVGPSADESTRYFEAANTKMGLVTARSDNQVGQYLAKRGESIYSVTYLVADAGRVAEHLTAGSVPVERVGDDIVVVPGETNHGIRLEFVTAGA